MNLEIRNKIEKLKYWYKYTKWNLTPEGSQNSKIISDLADKHKGRRCFILGNGPSLRKTNIDLLTNEITIASNGIFLLFGEYSYRPTYYTIEDRVVAEDRAEQINSMKDSMKLVPYDLAYCIKNDSMTQYINFIRRYHPFPKFSEKFAEVSYWGGTVTFLNIQLAYFLGCTEIYLIGVDHNYQVQPEQILKGPVIVSQADDQNHFHPDYFGKGYRWHDPNLERMELSYRCAKRFLEEKGVKIFNATEGGKLEVFTRKNYFELFNIKR